MPEECTHINKHENLASMLEAIPLPQEDAISIRLLCKNSLKSDPSCVACADAVLGFLCLFEAVNIFNDEKNGDVRIKAKSDSASYFLRSMSSYFRQGLTLATNWERKGVRKDKPLEEILSSGTRLVYLMEYRRTKELGDETPIRNVCVSQAIIKARLRGRLKPVYLVQYDANAEQFQLIGGRKRPMDVDELMVMKREIDEEIKYKHLIYGVDYELEELAKNIKLNELSPTYGAFTEYFFTLYQAFIKHKQLTLAPGDRWVTFDELINGKTKDGQTISKSIISDLDKSLRGGLKQLPLSLEMVQKRSIIEIIKERRWELFGLAFALFGILLSVIFFILQR